MIFVWGTVIFVCVVLSYLLQVAFHEIGHLLGGLLTGWKLIYLQVFHLVFTKGKGNFVQKVPSTSCQCIMYPKSLKSKTHLYTLGGLILNLMITVLGFNCMMVAGNHPFRFILSMSFFASGIALLIVNGIPHINLICNDMACYLLMKDNESIMRSHNTQFLIAKELAKGKSYSEISSELFDTIPYTEINDITAYNILLDYYYHMDRDEFMAAKNKLLKINNFSMVSKNVQRIYKLELFYLHMVLSIYGCDTFSSSLLPHRDEEEQYLVENTIQGDIHACRVGAMYQAFTKIREYDISGASESLCESINNLNLVSCTYSGEKLFCLDQLRAIMNMLNRMIISNEAVSM